MLRHHQHEEEPLSQDEYAKLLSEGEKTKGMVVHTEVLETERSRSHVRVEARFPDHQVAEFGAELSNVYQPAPGSPDAEKLTQLRSAEQLRHASRVPKIQLALSEGSMIPLRYNPTRRTRIVMPAKCPTCGAQVDQAQSSRDADPHCEFCHEPLPVTPMAAL